MRRDGQGRGVDGESGGGGGGWLGSGGSRRWSRRLRGRGGGGAGSNGVLQDGEPLANAAEVRGLVLDGTEEAGPARWRRR